MYSVKGNKYYNIVAIFLLIIIPFGLTKAVAQAPGNTPGKATPHPGDTTRTKINDATGAPLYLTPIPVKTTCDNPFLAVASGGQGAKSFNISNPLVAAISITTGLIVLSGTPGTATVSVKDAVGDFVQTTLTVSQAISPTIFITPANPAPCAGAYVTFKAKIANAGDNPVYQWTINGINVGTNADSLVTDVLQTGDQVICHLSNPNNHCFAPSPLASNVAIPNVMPLVTPTVTITSTALGPVPNNTPITFTASPADAGNKPIYQWYVNNTPVGKNAAVYTSSCFYNEDVITCIVTNTDGICLKSLTGKSNPLTVYVTDSAVPVEASISVSANNVYAGEEVSFKATVTNGSALGYQWQVNGENVAATDSTYTTFLLKNGDKVTCIVTTDNKCNPLITTNTITMIVVPAPPISIPNTFTPNGDNINDYWEIKNLILYRYCHVSVYSRYGALVFKSTGYSSPWDGKYRNNNLSTGTYYYVIDLGIHTRLLSGPVTIIR